MKKNLTELVFILDKSGSMWNLSDDTIGGYNALLKQNKMMGGRGACIHGAVQSQIAGAARSRAHRGRGPVDLARLRAERMYSAS